MSGGGEAADSRSGATSGAKYAYPNDGEDEPSLGIYYCDGLSNSYQP